MSLPPATGAVELASFQQYVLRLLAQNKRLDGRSLDAIRLPQIISDSQSITRTDGVLASTLYTDETGTYIQCTVCGLFGPPLAERPEEGRLTVDITAPFFPSYGADRVTTALREAAHFVRSTIISCMDLKELSILPGEACWVVQVELVVVNADGGLRAASLHAALAALHGMLLPRSRLPNGYEVQGKQLCFHTIPIATTIGVYKHSCGELRLLMDTSAAEESVVDGLMTVAIDDSNCIVGLIQNGSYPLVTPLLTGAINEFSARSEALRSAIIK
ncbi:3' exoribonuclease family domain [Trypanosoma vivax]|uniref:Ribosomal RNA-processing protein 43 n=1 Tax=Trypanosoma vivax (strain Y486) TaxID=1055687 RepID=G0U9I7_TRYVY|nr:putative exosome-associated protein 2 [Trypanosoma vivax]KAH8605185.1 3' exoribonuclease family domain [Trypanosoma vivax]CCC54273.1 putative exosome-associated protein 2 [Trypanosoma vivax Y486]